MTPIESYINELVQQKVEEEIRKMKPNLAIEPDNIKPVYTNKEMLQLLGVDPKTLKKYRDEGLLGFSHPFGKFLYSYQDLMNFLMNKNIRCEAFNIK
jgi:hypothetical protein